MLIVIRIIAGRDEDYRSLASGVVHCLSHRVRPIVISVPATVAHSDDISRIVISGGMHRAHYSGARRAAGSIITDLQKDQAGSGGRAVIGTAGGIGCSAQDAAGDVSAVTGDGIG